MQCKNSSYSFIFDESNESSFIDVDGISMHISKHQSEVKKIALSKIIGGLLFEISPRETSPETKCCITGTLILFRKRNPANFLAELCQVFLLILFF